MANLSLERLLFNPADSTNPKIGSYLIGAGGDVLTSTDVSGKKSLDVNVASITGVDLDIRDLVYTQDSVTAHQGGSWSATVSATDLDIRDLAFATDKVDVSGSEVSLSSATLSALENITVSATDLDIRDLTHVSDSVKVGDGTNFLAVTAAGKINVIAEATDFDIRDLAYATDSVTAHQGGTWSVTASATDLDIRDLAFATDKVDVSGSEVSLSSATLAALESITVSATDLDIRDLSSASDSVSAVQSGSWTVATDFLPNASVASAAVTVGTSAVPLPASPLSGRKRIMVQNNSDKVMYLGPAGVTSASGLMLDKGQTLSLEIGPSALLYAITSVAGKELRVFEQA